MADQETTIYWVEDDENWTVTTTAPDRMDRIEAAFEKIDRKLDVIAADQVEIKLSLAKTDERLNALETGVSELKSEIKEVRQEVKEVRGDLKDQGEKFQADLNGVRDELKTQGKSFQADLKAQDARLWGFVVALFLFLAGVLAKVVFFPSGPV